MEVSLKRPKNKYIHHVIFVIWSPYLIVIIRLDPSTEMCLFHKIKFWLLSPIYSFLHSFLPSFLPSFHEMFGVIFWQAICDYRGWEYRAVLSLIKGFTFYTSRHTRTLSLRPLLPTPTLTSPPPLHPTRTLVHWVNDRIIWTLSIEICFVLFLFLFFFHPGLFICGSSTHLSTLVW